MLYGGNLVFEENFESAIQWKMAGDKLEQNEFCLLRSNNIPCDDKKFLSGLPKSFSFIPISCSAYTSIPQFNLVDLVYKNKQIRDNVSSTCLTVEAATETGPLEARFTQCTEEEGDFELRPFPISGKGKRKIVTKELVLYTTAV